MQTYMKHTFAEITVRLGFFLINGNLYFGGVLKQGAERKVWI
jgi:hypothetical protein